MRGWLFSVALIVLCVLVSGCFFQQSSTTGAVEGSTTTTQLSKADVVLAYNSTDFENYDTGRGYYILTVSGNATNVGGSTAHGLNVNCEAYYRNNNSMSDGNMCGWSGLKCYDLRPGKASYFNVNIGVENPKDVAWVICEPEWDDEP